MTSPVPVEPWAEQAVEDACRRTTEWFRSLAPFDPRVNLGTVVGHKFPALLSEQDGVIHFARFLNEVAFPGRPFITRYPSHAGSSTHPTLPQHQ
jgi:hypothetical protein